MLRASDTGTHSFHPIIMLLLILVANGTTAWTQTFQVIHYFSPPQGYVSEDGLTTDPAGNLYGTTSLGGFLGGQCAGSGCGTVFRLAPHNSSWAYAAIYNFQGGSDGAFPFAPPVLGPDGRLYGTTYEGGGSTNCGGNSGCGTVYKLLPQPTVCRTALCYWSEVVTYAFANDGTYPESRVTFDSAGNLYGTTENGGEFDDGTVYELTPSTGSWNESVIHSFLGPIGGDLYQPFSGVILDSPGNVYGTGDGLQCGFRQECGAVYEVNPVQGGWGYQFIHRFTQPGDGNFPAGAPIWDSAGNMYGATEGGDIAGNNGPVIWKLSPSSHGWTETILYTWPLGTPGGRGSLTMDPDGNFYGVQACYGDGNGSVFKLTNDNGVWVYSTLHQFSGLDGSYPNGSLVVDRNGNIFGTTTYGGLVTPQCSEGCGVVFEISQQ
jgi:uncharacterized repeat protein (TIGR03803 family)